MRILRAALVATLVLAAPASAAGPLAPGMPDRTFAGDGTLRSSLASGDEVAASDVLPLGSGRLAVLTSASTVVRLKASGVRDPRFGTRGVARVRFFGDGNDSAQALVEDSDDALVVAGTRRRDVLAARRLLPNGRVDRDFGGGRVDLETGAFVSGVDVAMTPDGTALIAALVVPPYFSPIGSYRLLVLALDRQGRRVAGFGAGGVATIPLESSSFLSGTKLVRLADGRLRYAINIPRGTSGNRTRLAGFTAAGQPDPALGPDGVRAVGNLPRDATLASDASGRLLLAAVERRARRHDRLVALALTPDGDRDPAFGTDGIARITLPFDAERPAVAVRANRDAAIAMTRLDRPRRPAVALVRRDGSLVHGFGQGGFATIGGFHASRPTVVHAAAIDGLDRLVLGGESGDGLSGIREDFGRDYVAMARLRLRKSPLSLPARATVSGNGVMRVRVGCRAAGGCRAALTARRGTLRRRTVFRMRAGTQRVLQLRLGAAGVRLAAGHFTIRLGVTVSAAGRLEPLAVSVRLRRTA